MEDIFNSLIEDFSFTSNLKEDSNRFLIKQNRIVIAEHSQRVAKKAKMLAKKYGVDENSAEVAGLLHDIGGIYPNDKKIEVCEILRINILPEERELPLILHQKISKIMAQQIFNIQSSEILNAIECHTTLKANSSDMDKILFIADKIEWDQNDLPPYIDEIEKAVDVSLELAAFTYIKYLFNNSSRLKVVHPWLSEAYKELKNKIY